jgi:3-oxoacyl-[acyl-carrier protein] reductase
MGLLDGKVAVVTGAGRGIGRAHARLLASEGARIVVNDLGTATAGEGTDSSPAHAVVDEIVAGGGQAAASGDNVATWAGAAAVVQQALDEYGRLDIVVNNAGITGRSYPIWELTDEDWHQVLAVDLTSVFLVCRAAVRLMRPRRQGRIVNIASIAGKEGNPTLIPYSSAKAGVIGLTKALAKEVATHGILVHAVAPAVIGTELLQQMTKETVDMLVAKIPMGRVGTPAEVATLVAWLASDECTFTTGAVHDLSGGRATY